MMIRIITPPLPWCFRVIITTLVILFVTTNNNNGGGGVNGFVVNTRTCSGGKIQSTSSTFTTQLYLFDFLKEGKKALVKSLAGEYDTTAIRNRINTLIQSNDVVMLSFTTCPYCIKAKSILNEYNAKYTVIELDNDPDGKAIRAELADIIGRTSVPAIWIQQQYIGGCNDGGPSNGGIASLHNDKKLLPLLQQANAVV